ncbi:hypothetical protein IF2G_05191 [Cordyceps javanica]|nr:hypothetical protein IF2G_05191 [Cordyceps javanica]
MQFANLAEIFGQQELTSISEHPTPITTPITKMEKSLSVYVLRVFYELCPSQEANVRLLICTVLTFHHGWLITASIHTSLLSKLSTCHHLLLGTDTVTVLHVGQLHTSCWRRSI